MEPRTLSPTKAAVYLGIGKTKTLALIRAKRIQAKLLDGRVRVTTASCDAFLASLPGYSVGKPVRSDDQPPAPAKPKHGRRKRAQS